MSESSTIVSSLGRLRRSLDLGGCTQLGIGPMSAECVEVAIELANSRRVPLMLIASRRQIECEAHGAGYVNGWSSERFAAFVRDRDAGRFVTLCRDHAGPWQSAREVREGLPLEAAMTSSKESLAADIAAGFEILHLDPSIDIHDPSVPQHAVIDRLFDLYSFCVDRARASGLTVAFEIGSEEQSGAEQEVEVFDQLLSATDTFCAREAVERPLFVVVQTGTLVKEMRNVGSFDDPYRRPDAIPPEILVPRLINECQKHGVFLKEHNGDYLSDDVLRWHPRLGVHATNIAPEFGVGQTRALLSVCERAGLHREADDFLEVAYTSGQWRKWMVAGSTASDRDRAVIAGHYVFGTPAGIDVIERIRKNAALRGVDYDSTVRDALRKLLLRVMTAFRLCD